ncbi:DUF4129 domain-containing protein [Pyrococcus horikoshii]|uniref:DUF4129 domain-containing protein n=1 Tax=Pyrococcus horikoshii TaxID=53953 RepID=UPI000AF202E5|nr:DUF4129 domain-containing protein [Pyrococcus horikoshii]
MKLKILITFIGILFILGLMLGAEFNNKSGSERILELFLTLFIFGYIFIAMLFLLLAILNMEKIKGRHSKAGPLGNIILIVVSSLMLATYFLVIIKLLPHLGRVKEIANTSQIPPQNPLVIPSTFTRKGTELGLAFYVPVIIFMIALFLLSVSASKSISTIAEKRRIKKELQKFDASLEERGIDMFSNPREAVIELYKKAVLWLEVLGIPYRESWTHWEHASKVTYKRKAYVELAKLFEKAKYAPEKVTINDAERAYKLYMVIKGEE